MIGETIRFGTQEVEATDQVYNSYNKVFIATTKSCICWSGNEGLNVYISHTGPRLQVRFCNILMGVSNGMSHTTEASGKIVEH